MALASAAISVRDDVARTLRVADPRAGWTPAYSLTPRARTADGRLSGLLGAHYCGTPAGPVLVLDGELAVRTAGR